MVPVGRFELHSVITGRFRLDGGAMFGVVPRVLWSRHAEPDEQNRISLATRTLIAIDRAARRIILVDTGCGTKWAPEAATRFALEHDDRAIDRWLAANDLERSDVTDLVVTHLHFDHGGAMTDQSDQPGRRTVLRYPRARHWIHRRHWTYALAPHAKDRASFRLEDFEALEESDALEFVDGETPAGPMEGWAWLVTHGHTPYQLHPIFESDGSGLLFAGDMIPTRHHLAPVWVMAYDVEPMRTIDEKLRMYERCLRDGIGIVFPHDPDVDGVRLDGAPGKPRIATPLDLKE